MTANDDSERMNAADDAGDAAGRRDFIRDIIEEDRTDRQAPGSRAYPVPAGAERLPAYRPRQIHLPQFRHCSPV